MNTPLPIEFYDRPVLEVARDLLGMRLVRRINGVRLAGLITETEAYRGEEDQGCHARRGLTPRNAPMYGPPGRAYVYFTYGMHWMLNCITGPEGFPAAVLIRAMMPTENTDLIAARRVNVPPAQWTNGPAKLTQALSIDKFFNTANLCDPQSDLFIESALPVADSLVRTGPRVGLGSTPEPWLSLPWNFSAHLPNGDDKHVR